MCHNEHLVSHFLRSRLDVYHPAENARNATNKKCDTRCSLRHIDTFYFSVYTFNELQLYLNSIYQVEYPLRCEKTEFYLKSIFRLLKLKSKNSITYSNIKFKVANIVLKIVKN